MVKWDKQTGVVAIPLCSVCEHTKMSHWLADSIFQIRRLLLDNFDENKRRRFIIKCIRRKKNISFYITALILTSILKLFGFQYLKIKGSAKKSERFQLRKLTNSNFTSQIWGLGAFQILLPDLFSNVNGFEPFTWNVWADLLLAIRWEYSTLHRDRNPLTNYVDGAHLWWGEAGRTTFS